MRSIVATLSVFAGLLAATQAGETVEITVYYETLCSDSVAFIRDQLFWTWDEFKDSLHINYKPFGKAEFIENEDSWDFTCQHGPEECYGNKIHACLSHLIPEPESLLDVVYCTMTTDAASIGSTELCLLAYDLDMYVGRLYNCLDEQADSLLHDIGVETLGLVPKPNYVPWVLFNGEFNGDDLEDAQVDLKELLCRKFLTSHPSC